MNIIGQLIRAWRNRKPKTIPMAPHIVGTDGREYDLFARRPDGNHIYKGVADGDLYVMVAPNTFALWRGR